MSYLRLSTTLQHQLGLSSLLKHESKLGDIQKQLTTGQRVNQAKDDPAAVAAAQLLKHGLERMDQFKRNSDSVQSRLEIQDASLADVGDILQRAIELAIQANNTASDNTSRQALASEVKALRDSLLAVANRDDGNGRMLFAGTMDGITPFADNAGQIIYHGNDGQAKVSIGNEQTVFDTESGASVFMRVPGGNGSVTIDTSVTNTGTATFAGINELDKTAWNKQPFQISFVSATEWQVLDGAGNPVTPPIGGTGWNSTQKITVYGMEMSFNGVPDAGDSFTYNPAANQDMFTTLQKLYDNLNTPANTIADKAKTASDLTNLLSSLHTANEHILSMRARGGSQLNAIELATDTRASEKLSLTQNLSALTDTDFTESISRFTLQMTAYEAAQATIVKLAQSNLFSKM